MTNLDYLFCHHCLLAHMLVVHLQHYFEPNVIVCPICGTGFTAEALEVITGVYFQ